MSPTVRAGDSLRHRAGSRVIGRPAYLGTECELGRQSESTTTMTTKGGIVDRGGGLLTREARL